MFTSRSALSFCFAAAVSTGLLSSARADESPEAPVAHFSFNGHLFDEDQGRADFDVRFIKFQDDALYLNGKYEFGPDADGYHAICRTPAFQFTTFTVTLRFRAEEFTEAKSTLLVGGTSSRWFALARSKAGRLVVSFNNGSFKHEVENASLEPETWTVVTCAADLPTRKVAVFLDGKTVDEFDLPDDFKLAVIVSGEEKKDKVWAFANYSNANVFHGLIDELIIYNRVLSAEEIQEEFDRIPLKQSAVTPKTETGDAAGEFLTKSEKEMLDLVNRERFKFGRPPLKASRQLAKAARSHAENMARQEILNHTLDGKTFDKRIEATGYRCSAAGENISNAATAAAAIAWWMESPGHQRNLLSAEYEEIGIGVGTGKSRRTYWTQVFGKPDPQP